MKSGPRAFYAEAIKYLVRQRVELVGLERMARSIGDVQAADRARATIEKLDELEHHLARHADP